MSTELSITEAFEKWADDLTRYATVLVGTDDAVDAVNQAFADVMASERWDGVTKTTRVPVRGDAECFTRDAADREPS